MLPLPDFEGGFGFTAWETSAQFPSPPQHMAPAHEDDRYPAQAHTATRSGSEELSRDEERRIRRMISNRESARRSRMRKQRNLEELRNRADRLRLENRELANRLGAVTSRCLLYCRDNDQLRSEATVLRRRLIDLRRVLLIRQLQRLVAPAACGGIGGPVHVGKPQAANVQVYGGGFTAGTEQTLLT
ncbi:hypothetical protein Taro_027641 [Colocasia esculenta]|uniref:BZIP domain-containing protein n=1 Tax=Colocasia esculenta TaxID=4460 RepID=A0A843VIN0_COLES|nr:hypothetical protein [Colocasia esculenta]